jgi:hypothetical protein
MMPMLSMHSDHQDSNPRMLLRAYAREKIYKTSGKAEIMPQQKDSFIDKQNLPLKSLTAIYHHNLHCQSMALRLVNRGVI